MSFSDEFDEFFDELEATGDGVLHLPEEKEFFSLPNDENYYAAESLYDLGSMLNRADKGVKYDQAQIRQMEELAYEINDLDRCRAEIRLARLFFDPRNIAIQVRAMTENWSHDKIRESIR